MIRKNTFKSVDGKVIAEKVDCGYNRDVVVVPRTVSRDDAIFRAIDRRTLEVDHVLRMSAVARGANTAVDEYKHIERASSPASGLKSESMQRRHGKLFDARSRDSRGLAMTPKCTIATKSNFAVVHRMVSTCRNDCRRKT